MKKFLSIALLAMMLVFSFGFSSVAFAQVSSFPAGCTSTMGSSTTTGLPCNGSSSPTTSFMSGCTSTVGFSTTTGLACNGGTSNIASTSFFPGCTSIMGFSTTTGRPCNGGTIATTSFLAGCTSTLGTSITTGLPCSGGLTALPYLAGCTTIYGFSTVTGQPCNGTSSVVYDPNAIGNNGDVAVINVPDGIVAGVSTPGLPTTGLGGEAVANMLLLAGSGLFSILGVGYLIRRRTS